MKNFDLISIIAALFAVMVVYNVANAASTSVFPVSRSRIPSTFGISLVCTLSALRLCWLAAAAASAHSAGQGSSDSAVTFLGMLIGAAFAHNFGLVGAAAKAATETEPAVAGGPAAAGKIAVIVCIVVLFVIAGTNLRRKKTAK